MYLNQCVY